MKLARDIISNHFQDERGALTLFEHRGTIWHWEGRWRPRSRTWLLDRVRLSLENSYYKRLTRDGSVVEPILDKQAPPTRVLECMETVTRVDEDKTGPFWLAPGPQGEVTDPEVTVTFRDRVVDVGSSSTMSQTPNWFDPVYLNAKYIPAAACPLWLKCLQEWSGGDAEWCLLLQRLFGYAILPTREFQKWFLFYGVPRSGKGTVLATMRRLIGSNAVLSKSLTDLVGPFGLEGLESARVMVVNEVHDLDHGEGARASSVIKQLVGQDPISVNIKYVRPLRNVESRALPILQSNEIPTLEDRAGGLSTKMVLVPFGVSFLNRENESLARQLGGEMTGIAQWALQGARDVLHNGGKGRFPMLEAAKDAVDDYYMANNPYNQFLGEYFTQDERGWVAFSVVWERWQHWRHRQRVQPGVNEHTFTRKLIEGCNWRLGRSRRGPAGDRGFVGLRLRYVPPKADETD
jgi:putative DNA primase/helicase